MNSRWIFCSLITFLATLYCKGLHAKSPPSLEESLELKRIAEYYQEKDYLAVKRRILEFIQKNPESEYLDPLYATLGDLYFRERRNEEALEAYEQIKSQELKERCSFTQLQCWYNKGFYEKILEQAPMQMKREKVSEKRQAICWMLAEAQFDRARKERDEGAKRALLEKALSSYRELVESTYVEKTFLPQGLILSGLKRPLEAAQCYLLLAETELEKKEEYLFHAASLQVEGNLLSGAIETFAKVCALDGKWAEKAAFNQLVLLFQNQQYREFVLKYDELRDWISAKETPSLVYCLGRAFLHLKDHARASVVLSEALTLQGLDRVERKGVLLGLIACAKDLEDLELLEKTISELKKDFSQEKETKQVLLMHLAMKREKRDWKGIHEDVQALEEAGLHLEQMALVKYDQGLALIQEKRWKEAGDLFEEWMDRSSDELYVAKCARQFIHCRMQDATQASFLTEEIKQELFLQSLNKVLQNPKGFTSKEKKKLKLLQGKTLFSLQRYEEAAFFLQHYCTEFSQDPSCQEAYLLLAYCHQLGTQDLMQFALNAEKALLMGLKQTELHLELYNAYLQLAKEANDEEKQDKIEKAASHLYVAIDEVQNPDNLRWLANYYQQRAQQGDSIFLEKATCVLEKLVGKEPLIFDEHSLEKEAEMIELAKLYRQQGDLDRSILHLERLFEQQKEKKTLPWKYQRMTAFELAKGYVENRNPEKALPLFDSLIETSSHLPSFYTTAAKLEKAKLEFSLLEKEEQREDCPTLCRLYDQMKEIQIQRRLYSEPLHLEAALCYIEMKTAISNETERKEKQQELLVQMKEHLTKEDDPVVISYFSQKELFPEKVALFEQYLTFIDLEIERIENSLEDHLKEKFDQLEKNALHPYLKMRIIKSKEALK